MSKPRYNRTSRKDKRVFYVYFLTFCILVEHPSEFSFFLEKKSFESIKADLFKFKKGFFGLLSDDCFD